MLHSSTYPVFRLYARLLHSGSHFLHILFRLSSFVYRQRFTDKVKHRLGEILADYTTRVNKKRKHKKISVKSCSLVCVHIRRGDHLEYEKLNGADHLKKQYFLQAMDVYKESLRHPVFIIVTDDTQWAKDNIHRSFNPYYTGWRIYLCRTFLNFPPIFPFKDSTTRVPRTQQGWTWQSSPPAVTWSCLGEHLGCGETFCLELQESCQNISPGMLWGNL